MAIEESWLQQFAHDSLGSFNLTPRIERWLSRRALAARHAPAERDALFVDLSAVIAGRVARYRSWDLSPWELDDILQESYLVFIDVHALWSERVRVTPSGTIEPGFGLFLLRVFPLRLADRVDDLLGVTHAHMVGIPLPSTYDTPDPELPEADIRARMLIETICARLNPRDAITFRLVISTEFSIRAVARRTGENPRTLYHRWERICETARAIVLGGLDDVAA